MALQVQPVLQAKWAEVVLAELAVEVALHLVAELADAVIDQALIGFVIAVHDG